MRKPYIWTAEKIELLRRLYPSNFTKDIAYIFGMSPHTIATAAYRYGIRKNPEIRAKNGAATQFKKGQQSHNKGRKWSEYMPAESAAKCARTQFKSGDIPFNARPMYSERIDSEGYVMIKVPGHDKFVLKHRWRWEQAHGPIPKGCQIHFRDGNRSNCELSNLEMITREECARRNSYWSRYPKEVASLIQLKGALKRQINKQKSNQNTHHQHVDKTT